MDDPCTLIRILSEIPQAIYEKSTEDRKMEL